MGQVVKQVSNHSTRYYWYPGDKKEWVRGGLALVIGGASFAILHMLTHNMLLSAVVGTSLAAGAAGFNFGRRDSRELVRFADIAKSKYVRLQTAVHTGRAVWRGIVEGTGGAAAAVIIVNLSERGLLADWLLPLVPAVVGALAHQLGMMYEHLGTSQAIEGPAKRPAGDIAPRHVAGAADGPPKHAAGHPSSPAPAVTVAPDTAPAPAAPAEPAAVPVVATVARAVGTARVPSMILSAAAAGKLQPVSASDANEPATVLRFDPVADCGTVARARDTTALAGAAAGPAKVHAGTPACTGPAAGEPATADGGTEAGAGAAPAAGRTAGLSLHHAAVALPPTISTFKHGKPPMPLSAALAARGDLAHIADALGAESLTESRKYSAK